jgi:arabinogalactan oligomer/maltooligosaccharide transport system permease protein
MINMVKCHKCGLEVPDTNTHCSNCGAEKIVETNMLLWGIISAFLPVVGLILRYMWKDSKPRTIAMITDGLWSSIFFMIVIFGTIILGAFNTTLLTIFWILIGLVLLFTHQSLAVAIADKKGQNTNLAGFIGLVPVYGLYYYLTCDPVRPLSPTAISSILRPRNILGTMVIYAELSTLAAVVLIPIIYAIGTSLSPNAGILNTLWPENPSLVNYEFLLSGSRVIGGIEETTYFRQWYGNTLGVAVLTMIFAVLFVTGTAYVFARYKFKGKKAGLLTILVLQMFPSFLSLIAIFTLFQSFGLTNNPYALVIIYATGGIPFNVWLIKGYLQNVPKELDESAKIDGANKIQIFFKIILPLSVPIISFVAVTSFMSPWMDYILPSFLIIDSEKWTLAVGIFDFINDPSDTNYPAFAAAALIVAVPITTLYVVFQRYLIEGITAGANKG